jgi:hypothetical protein
MKEVRHVDDEYILALQQSLATFQAQEAQAQARLARVRRIIETIHEELRAVVPAPRGLTVRATAAVECQQPKPAAETIGEARTLPEHILRFFAQNPGANSSVAANRLQNVIDISSENPRKVILTRIGQLVRDGRLWKDDESGEIFPASQNGNGQEHLPLTASVGGRES